MRPELSQFCSTFTGLVLSAAQWEEEAPPACLTCALLFASLCLRPPVPSSISVVPTDFKHFFNWMQVSQ